MLLLLLPGCALRYTGPVLDMPMLSAPGDMALSAHTGAAGFQGDAALAPAPGLSLHGEGQYSLIPSSGDDSYFRQGSFGVGTWYAPQGGGAGPRLDARINLGLAQYRRVFTGAAGDPVTVQDDFLHTSIQADAGWAWARLEIGIGSRLSWNMASARDLTGNQPGDLLAIDGGALLRFGAKAARFNLYGGFSLVGGAVQPQVDLGMSVRFPLRASEEAPPPAAPSSPGADPRTAAPSSR